MTLTMKNADGVDGRDLSLIVEHDGDDDTDL